MLRQTFPFVKQSSNSNNNVNPGWNNLNQNQYNNKNYQYNQYDQYNQYGNNYGFQNNNNKPRPPIPFSTANVN